MDDYWKAVGKQVEQRKERNKKTLINKVRLKATKGKRLNLLKDNRIVHKNKTSGDHKSVDNFWDAHRILLGLFEADGFLRLIAKHPREQQGESGNRPLRHS